MSPHPTPRTQEQLLGRAEVLLMAANDFPPGSPHRTPYVLEALTNAVLALVPDAIGEDAPPVAVTVVGETKRPGGTWQ